MAQEQSSATIPLTVVANAMYMSSFGGTGFPPIYVAKIRGVRALNFYKAAPELYQGKDYSHAFLSVPDPSCLKEYELLHNAYGGLFWSKVLQPEVEHAESTGGYELLSDGSIHPDREGPPQGFYVIGTIRSSNKQGPHRFEPTGNVRGTGQFGKSGHPGWLELHDGSFHGDEEARVPARPYVRGFRVSDRRF